MQATGGTADSALGEILSVAAIGQMGGPLLAGTIAQATDLRVGLLVMLPALLLCAAIGVAAHHHQTKTTAPLTRPAAHRT